MWTNEKPKEPGLYWVRKLRKNNRKYDVFGAPRIVELSSKPDDSREEEGPQAMYVLIDGSRTGTLDALHEPNVEWSGPFAAPLDWQAVAPTKPGLYWCADLAKSTVEMVELDLRGGLDADGNLDETTMDVWALRNDVQQPLADAHGHTVRWLGPITTPPLPDGWKFTPPEQARGAEPAHTHF